MPCRVHINDQVLSPYLGSVYVHKVPFIIILSASAFSSTFRIKSILFHQISGIKYLGKIYDYFILSGRRKCRFLEAEERNVYLSVILSNFADSSQV